MSKKIENLMVGTDIQPSLLTGFDGANKEVFSISLDGKVTLSDSITIDNLTDLEMPYLFLLREIVNTAIYDKGKK